MVLAGAHMLFQTDLKKVQTVFKAVYKQILAIVAIEDAQLIKNRLWADFYQTVCRFYFWY